MFALMIITIIWSFSFSLIGIYLNGQIDVWFAVFVRIGLACLLFLPFLRLRFFSRWQIGCLMLIGAIQLGVMYFFYYSAFYYLSVPEVLLFTILTPIYITLIYDLLQKKPLRWSYLGCAVLAVIGAGIIRYHHISSTFFPGFLLIQGANICFAFGQVAYKRLIEVSHLSQHHAFSLVYLGALITSFIGWVLFGHQQIAVVTSLQWSILVWLGVVASGLGYFIWNYGATRVDSGTLAIMNNMVIPCGIMVNVLFWHQSIDWLPFLCGSIVMIMALYLHQYNSGRQ